MKKSLCYLLILMAGIHSTGMCDEHRDAKVLRAKKILKQLDAKAEEYLDLFKVPGAAIGVVVEGEIVYKHALGKRNITDDLPVTTSSLFQIASASKPFTSFLIGQLVDQSKLHWDDAIVEHLPRFRLQNPFTTYEITIRDYLTHISGYSRHDVSWYGDTISRQEMLKRMRYLEPAYGYREKFYYQNLGYMIVGMTAEAICNKSWEELIDEMIFTPLDMKDTNTDLNRYKASSNHCIGYRESELGIVSTPFVNPYTISPAGGINSNVNDMVKWVANLTNKGGGLIEESTFKEMITPQVVSNVILGNRFSIDDLILMETYGLGWFVLNYRGHEAVLHGGNIEGFSSSVCFFPQENFGLVVLTNKNYSPLPYVLTSVIADLVLGVTPIDWTKRIEKFTHYDDTFYFADSTGKKAGQIEGTTPSHHLREYAGVYENPGYSNFEIKVENGRLAGIYNHIDIKFDHFHHDTFEMAKDTSIPDIVGIKASFRHNFFGEIDELVIPFESAVGDIVFKKRKNQHLFTGAYLDRFLGMYSYLGFDIAVKREQDSLTVTTFGQAPFILVPEKDGLFTVEGYDDYTVQFLVDEDSAIIAVQLIQPNNTTYTAYKQRSY